MKPETKMSVYTDNGYEDREDYLAALCELAGEEAYKVRALADLLGPDEDFDGLVTMLQDDGVGV